MQFYSGVDNNGHRGKFRSMVVIGMTPVTQAMGQTVSRLYYRR